MPNKTDMIEQLRKGEVSLPPLSLRILGKNEAAWDSPFDALVEASWGKHISRFVVECKTLSTPKAFRDGLNALKVAALPNGYSALLFVPFLNAQQLQTLERENLSGIDLCGNGIIIAPERFAVFRTGGKNRFTSSAPIKNVYRKNSSMVARSFLVQPTYNTVQDILVEINSRNLLVKRWGKKAMSLSTVSKVLKTLEEDLVVGRDNGIHLLQPDKLLQKLSENYETPNIKKRVRLKLPESLKSMMEMLYAQSTELKLPLMAAGMSSTGQYAVMQRGAVLTVCCPDLNPFLERLNGDPSDRFPNLELLEVDDEAVYFDTRQKDGFWWASPVQVYFELMAGDKRDQETADQVKAYILSTLKLESK